LLYCYHVECDGEGLFRLACQHDNEGIVAKHKGSPYLTEQQTSWEKIRNRSYSQWVGREELFESERGGDPDFRGWDDCVRACAEGAVVAVQNWEGSSGISRRVASELIVYVLAKDHSGTHI